MPVYKRTIESVLDMETGEEISADSVFSLPDKTIFNLRRRQEEAYRKREEPKFACYYCKQPTKIKGGPPEGARKGKTRVYFAHFKDSDDCPIKTGTKLTQAEIDAMKYNGAKESGDHIRTKNMIGEFLSLNESYSKGASEITIDQVYKSEKIPTGRRKPDVRCKYFSDQLVFEIQLSTTYISVISDREHFYKTDGSYLLWIFKHFNQEKDDQTFTEKDIYYANFENVFVLDEEAIAQSILQDDLVLHCYYNQHTRNGHTFEQQWTEKLVTLADLTYDEKTKKVFFYNPEAHLKELQDAYKAAQEDLRKKNEDWIRQNDEIIKQAREKEGNEQAKRKKAQDTADRKRRDEEMKKKAAAARTRQAQEMEQIRELNYNSEVRRQNSEEAFQRGNKEIYQLAVRSITRRTEFINQYLNYGDTTIDDLTKLFEQGYQPNELDTDFLNNQFKLIQEKQINIAWRKYMESIAFSIFYLKVKNENFFTAYPEIRTVLLAILSLKLKKAFTPKLMSLEEMFNLVLSAIPEFAFLLLKAKSVYQEDFPVEYPAAEVKQNDTYNWTLQKVFPELFET